MNAPAKARLKLLLIGALFFAPVVAAITIFFFLPQYIPEGRVNYGTLVSPSRALPALTLVDASAQAAPTALQGKWTLIYLAGANCDEQCHERLVLTRQVRLALNEKRGRVQRVYLAPGAAEAAEAKALLSAEHPDLVFLAEPARAAAEFFKPADPHALYLLDPLGNWMMTYTGVVEHKGLHRDLKKLLRVSQVG
jgi:hypothetical protein